MPEKSKRRKNNKNKRKNKNVRSDSNRSTNSDVKDLGSVESSSVQSLECHESNETVELHSENVAKTSQPCENDLLTTVENDLQNEQCDQSLQQDLNNNSENSESCDSIIITADAEIPDSAQYIVESPEQSVKSKQKLCNKLKSKSLDNDDDTKIVEITEVSSNQCEDDNTMTVIDSNILVSDVESDIEWEKIDEDSATEPKELATGTLSITTIPLNVAQCKHTKSLTPDEEISLRHYLKTLNLSTHPNVNTIEIKTEIEQIINREIRQRLRKKGLADDFVPTRLGPPRILDVIDEEGSGESSLTSRRQSYLSDKKSDNEELEDDVFEEPAKVVKSQSLKYNTIIGRSHKMISQLVPQECVLVGAKIKEPEVAEARGDWTMKTVEKMKGAEIVYLTDSSSSTSSIHEIDEDTDNGEDTDVSVRMITPTIEVTDTDKLLKNTFISESSKNHLEIEQSVHKSHSPNENKANGDSPNHNNDTNDLETEKSHEIIVSSIDDIKTNLYVKDIEENSHVNTSEKNLQCDNNVVKTNDDCDLEIKVLKCELNDAINNLIKEVSDSENNENPKDNFVRQDSSSSVGSSSQCTAKYNPTHSSLNDVSSMLHDENITGPKLSRDNSQENSHVKDVFECVTGASAQNNDEFDHKTIQPSALRDICVRRISTLPYGDKILEELASVSERLQSINSFGRKAIHNTDILSSEENNTENMPYYPLPDVSTIEKVSLPVQQKKPQPPPVQPRNSSLKKSQDDNHWTGVQTEVEPVYVCFSPSQKMLMEKTNTVITKEDATQLVDMHKKYVDRRGYNEPNHIKKHEVKEIEDPPIVPFKSQTGSRLLALIRDPTVSSNVNSKSKSGYNSSYENIKKYNSNTELISRTKDGSKFATFSTNFKPIPPPRPKKYSSSFYESDESSDFTDSSIRSIRSEKKLFHYSTGNLNKDIENDISSIQNMHRYYTNTRDSMNDLNRPRRPSLPKDLCDQQMEYIRQKEKEVEAEIKRLEQEKTNISTTHRTGPRAPLIVEKKTVPENNVDDNHLYTTRKKDDYVNTQSSEKLNISKLSSVFSSSQEELLRDKMYSEYVTQMAERQERKQHKIIKITNPSPVSNNKTVSKSMSALEILDAKVNNRIEKEFISKARERWNKLGIADPETEDERDKDVYREPKVIKHKIKVIEGGEETDVKKLPSHLQEFVSFTAKQKEQGATSSAVWRPGAPTPPPAPAPARSPGAPPPPPPPPPVWTPGSAGPSPQAPRKTFRPVHFAETPPARRKFVSSEQNGCTSGSESEGRLRTSHSAPVTGLNNLGGTSNTSRLPKAQNPTVTLLQKAREGQIPRVSSYLQQERDAARLPRDRPSPPIGDLVHALRKEYASESEAERSEYERVARKMADTPRKLEGIGPTTKDGMPVTLRSEVKDPSRWYKKMYDTIHKSKYDDDYVTIRYKNRRGQPPQRVTNKSQYAYFDPRSGYLSEPEGGLSRLGSSTWSDAYDSDVTSGPRRRTASVQEERRVSDASSPYLPNNKYSTLASARASQEVYKNQPGRIENYVPGKSSVVDKEAKQWWDEVMDIFDGQNISSTTSLPQASPKDKKDLTSTILSKSNMARALKESGYESDSTLVFRRRDDTEAPLSPAERRAAYRDLQAGGEPPLRGFRSPAPPRTETDSAPEPPRRTPHGSYSDTESPRRYLESDVNIHYRCPVRQDPLPLVPERELARQQAEHMKKLYREQRRNKYLQELQDMQNRRHQDNFTPSQKNILPLNRYDEAERIVARALYAFNGQTTRELSFRKGDLIHVRRQIDANWYEGEIHGRIGLFPYNYVEIMKGEVAHSPKKPAVIEGRARAKFDFTAQTNLELPLKKGEVVVLTRRIDQNWWEGRNGSKTGIFPDSYVTILQEPSQSKPEPQMTMSTDKPVASPAAHGLLNGTAKRSMGAHSYMPQPNNPALGNAPPATQPLPGYVARPAQARLSAAERGYGPPAGAGVDLNNTEPLYVDTNAEAVPYRAMYKYRPQNPDELELNEGDTVYVLEKCDDGWYVGSSQRTGRFGTFPGNYVERI